MATQLPSTGKPGCDTSDMFVIHGLFRSVFGDAPGLVRKVAEGEADRTAVVASHVREIATSLHNHHHGEDLLLWDQLKARSPACAAHVGEMRAQHRAVATQLEVLDKALDAWEKTSSAVDREKVGRSLDSINARLIEHLGAEETKILPTASTTFSQREWDKLGEHGMSLIPKNRLLVQLGFMLDSMRPQERAPWLRAHVPGPARLLYRVLGRRQYEQHRATVYGTRSR